MKTSDVVIVVGDVTESRGSMPNSPVAMNLVRRVHESIPVKFDPPFASVYIFMKVP